MMDNKVEQEMRRFSEALRRRSKLSRHLGLSNEYRMIADNIERILDTGESARGLVDDEYGGWHQVKLP